MSKTLSFFTLILFVFLFLTPNASAQNIVCDGTCTLSTGSPSYGGAATARAKMLNARGSSSPTVAKTKPKHVPKTETVIGSQSYNYVIPILSIPGRAGSDLVLNLYYNSRVWDVDTVGNTITFNADRDFPSYGFRLDFGYVELTGGQYIVTENDGTKHALQVSDVSTALYDSTDGTYMEYNTLNNSLTYRNGTIIYYDVFPSQLGQLHPTLFRPSQIRDTNGNNIYFSYLSGHDDLLQSIVDTGNRVISFNYDQTPHLVNITQSVQVSPVDPTGVHTYATFSWTSPYASGQTWYSFSGFSTVNAPTASQISVLAGCNYANGTGYRFTYGDWGIVKKIEKLTSNGTPRSYISYNYPLTSAGPLTDAPAYTQQTVSPDGGDSNTSVWNYMVTKAGTGVVTNMAVTDPLGNISSTTLDPNTGLTSSVQLKDSSNAVLRTINYAWTSSGPGTVPASITSTLNDTGQQSSVQYSYDGITNTGNVSDVYEYDFGSVLKRHTVTTYQNSTNINYHILTLPTRIVVKDGAGNTISRTDMAYDGGSLTSVTGAANHDDPGHGAGFTVRGNLTSVTRYSNAAAGTGPVTRNFTYDTLGNLLTAQVDCCNTKTFTFSSATQYDYPDSIVRGPSSGPQFTTRYTYDSGSGLPLTKTDENGQVTQFHYDSINRTIAVLMPPQESGTVVQLNTSYDDASVSPTVSSYTSNSGNSAHIVTTLDGLGHVMQQDTRNGATLISSTKSIYDKLWRRTQASSPFAPDETPVYTTFAYDSLGRPTRITAPSAGYTQFSYLGNAVTATDPAGKQRKNFTDALGRLIEVDEPGWGDAIKGSGSITFSGTDRSMCPFDTCIRQSQYVWDTGTIQITANGSSKSTTYGHFSTPSSIAQALANAINADTSYPVTAGLSGATISLTSAQPGASTNYSFSWSSATSDPTDFGAGTGSFGATVSGPTLTGGLGGTPEGSPTLARPIVTTYVYDVLDNLTSAFVAAMGPVNGVTYAGQPRTYVYDSISRLTSATTPESGTVTNYYTDINSSPCANDPALVCRVTDARNITKSLTYDGINRILSVTHNDGTPTVSYSYDYPGASAFALGRLTSISDGANTQSFTYDNLGRITSTTQNIDETPYTIQYAYNPVGQITRITYPSNHVVTQTYDDIGRLSSIATGSTMYLSGLTYNAAGQTLGLTMGNGVQGAFSYNDHIQLASIRYFKTGLIPDPLNLTYDYTSTAQPNNNGQIQAIHYYTQPGVEDQTKSEAFTYDAWFRLKAAQTINVDVSTPGTWSLTWAYDRLGNRKQQQLVGGNLPGGIGQPTFAFDENTNRITGFTYDNAGNITADGVFTYAYDGANRMNRAQQTAFPNTVVSSTFFGPMRIKKVVGSTTTRYIYIGSRPIAEYVGTTNPSLSKEYIYAGTRLVATIAGTSTTYHHPDHLSNRAETDSTGALTRSVGTFPYGEIWYGGDSDQFKFTTYTRDDGAGEPGLDYAQFRHYAPGLARFMSPDPLAGFRGNPQSLNRYAYVNNDPINHVDPAGTVPECVPEGECQDSHAFFPDAGFPMYISGPGSAESEGDTGDPVDATSSSPLTFDGSENLFSAGTTDEELSRVFCGICPDGLVLPGMFVQAPVEDIEPEPERELERDTPEETPWITLEPGEKLEDLFWPSISDAVKERGENAYDLFNPGPLPEKIASSFAGYRYIEATVASDGVYLPRARVFGGHAEAVGRNGTFYSPYPQFGGIQSLIDLALRPEWGNRAENTVDVFLQPGTKVYVGISSYQGDFALGGQIQIYVPPPK